MIVIKRTDLKGKETGVIAYYSETDRKELAEYHPERKVIRNGKCIKIIAENVSFNGDRLTHEPKVYGLNIKDKTLIERAKPQYKAEIAELLKIYEDVQKTEHSYL